MQLFKNSESFINKEFGEVENFRIGPLLHQKDLNLPQGM